MNRSYLCMLFAFVALVYIEKYAAALKVTRLEGIDQLPTEQELVKEPTRPDRSKRFKRSLIVPGTNWCGVGNIAAASNVTNGESDQCCRDHDHCPHTIEGFSRKYNVYNYRFYTISHCECDDIFRTCLRSANVGLNSQAMLIGQLYFNYVGMKCFVFVRETVCAEREWWGGCKRETTQWTAELRDPLTF